MAEPDAAEWAAFLEAALADMAATWEELLAELARETPPAPSSRPAC